MLILHGVVLILLRLVTSLNGVRSQGVTCQRDWARYGNHCYRSGNGVKTWTTAQDECQKQEGNLVSIETAGENSWLKTFPTSLDDQWIGANDRNNEGDWRWVADNSKVLFADWKPNEPNSQGGNEDCVHFYTDNQWNDIECSYNFPFICEKEGCLNIANCITTVCTSLADITCSECQKILFKLYNSNKECARTCSWENRWCWPGSCGNDNYAEDCSCESESFSTVVDGSQARCELTKVPEILTCRMEVVDVNNDALMSQVTPGLPTHCSNQEDFYGNIQVDRIITNSSFELAVDVSHVQKPDYITNHAFGVTDVEISIVMKPILDNEIIVKTANLHSDPNSNAPKHLLSFDVVMDNSSPAQTLSNGERLCVRFVSRGGGHLVSKNIITRDESEVAFPKTLNKTDLCYRYDDVHPMHCLEQQVCANEPLDIASRILTSRSFQINVTGWEDPSAVPGNTEYASGIDTYIINVYEVKEAGPELLEVGRVPVVLTPINASQPTRIIIPEDLPNPALYAVVLEVKDVANNVKQARRFVMFDNSSKVLAKDDKPFYSTTTTSSTANKWQTNHGRLCYSWIDRYYNDKFYDLDLLRPIKPDYHGHMTGIYEQISGILPVSGTENVHGITQFYFSLASDTKTIFTKKKVHNFTSQTLCLSPTVHDGETYRFDVEAHDIMNHTYAEYVYTHIDSSKPEIFHVGLEKDGYKLLNVHNSSDLSKMILKFNALDIHSGLYSVDWSLGTSLGGHDIGNGSLGVIRLANNESCPEHSNCYCPSVGRCAYFNFTLRLNSLVHLNTHNGNHNRGYHFTLTVTNEARLVYVDHTEVLTDDSPPAIGVVREGPAGGLDIDYTNEETVIAHWDGYIDHESGIRSYRVGLAKSCLGKEGFSATNISGAVYKDNEKSILETTHTSAYLTLPQEGQYFVTVVAYNNAMEPSDPVCSDGIVLDKTPPVVVNVTIQSASVTEGVVCSDETAWYVTKNLTRYRIGADQCDKLCRNASMNEFISLLPVESSHASYHSKSCTISDSHGMIYLPLDLIHLQWNIIEPDSQIHEVYIGIGSTRESSASPDLIDFHKSPHKYSYKKRHVGLSDGDEIYIFLKITNSAGLTTSSTIGPVLVDETPPICPSSLPVSINNGFLYIYWNEGTIYDNEQKEPITSFVFRVGQQGSHVSVFRPMEAPDSAKCVKMGKICLTIPLSDLHVYDIDFKLTFNIQLHVFNNAGYYCTVNTDTFRLPSRHPPGHGVVYDVAHAVSNNLYSKQDIDVLIPSGEFCVMWKGFEHYGDIEFELGIGRIPGSDDTIPFHNMPEREVYCENATNLSCYHRYFVTVRAITSGGTAVAISDGFVIIHSSDITASLRVYDGYGCASSSRTSLVLEVGTNNTYVPSNTALHVGHTYTLESNTSITVESDDVIVKAHWPIDMLHYYQFAPLDSRPQFKIISDLNHTVGINILDCLPDVDSQSVSETVSLHWNIGLFNRYISYYEVELISLSHEVLPEQTSPPVVIAYTRVSGKSKTYTFGDISLVKGRYYFVLRPCIEYRCLDPVRTNGFVITDQVYDSFYVSSSLNRTAPDCSDVYLSVTDLSCPNGLPDVTSDGVNLRWGLFRDKAARIQLTDWNVHLIKETNTTTVLLSKCLQMPLYPHVKMFTCVEVYCPVGSKGVKCVPLIVTEDPNVFEKIRLYEVDADADDVRNNKDSFYAANIGNKMTWLHGAELDFTARPVRPGGVILGMGDRLITWYLVRDSNSLNQSCEGNPNCVASVQTLGGFSAFQGINLEDEVMYFICADFHTVTNGKGTSLFQTCGNGFVIDINPPSIGDVTIPSERGYLIDRDSVIVHWDGFQDFLGYQTLGYPCTIATFTYYIGSEPYGQDLVAQTNIGLYKSVKIYNPQLRLGEIYYATVTAFDHVGHSTSAVSKGVTFDNTGPVTGIVHVGTYLRPTDIVTAEINVHWIGFHDDESGISKSQLGIGSTTHVPDVVDYQEFSGEFASLFNLTALHDGHGYYAIILITNGAGLSTVASSDAFVIDRSSPTEGTVRDGLLTYEVEINFQANTTHGGCHWSGFSDPHSGISYYSAGLATTPLGDDVRALSSTGTKTEFQWAYNCIPGTTYYCTVQACNGAGLCTSVSSNGFTTDYSPPLPGIVHVGIDGHHSRYWAHANSIQVEWFGFVDVDSGIRNYEVCVRRTNSSECDILPFTNVLMSNIMTYPVHLPHRVSLSVEVRAYNPLNMSVKSVSDSFIVDPTPPVLVTNPVLGTENGGSNVVVQSDPSLVTLKWKFIDEESPIVKHIISVRTHHDGHTPVENVYLSNADSHIFTLEPNNWLRPGDTYTAFVTTCNEAGLCTSATSNELLVDPTPPHLGGFEEPLPWHMSSDSNETVTFINLTIHGFKDIESGIKTYYVSVGDSYSGSEISDGVLTFLPSNSESETIQLIVNEGLQSGRQLILSVWAENNAGLFSDIGKVTVTVIVSNGMNTFGYLEILKHSCDAEYCNKDCTCAVISQKCHTVDVDTDCTENNQTDDYDLRIHILDGGKHKDQKALSATSACISANWTITGTRGQGIKRIEWSMGQLDMPVGTGIFDPLFENLWYDVGQRSSITHCVRRGNNLLHDTSYIVYVRAWTSTSYFTVFTSLPIHIDNTYPSVRKGQYISENSVTTCNSDLDFTTTLDTLTACWSGVFTDPQSDIYKYLVALGTIPGGDDVISINNVGLNTSKSWVGLSLSPGTKYYVTVTCINHLGIRNTLASDGIMADNESPHAGVVFNTYHFRNAHVQNAQDVGASFWGFQDRHSAIKSFSIALQISYTAFTTQNQNTSLVFQDIALRNTYTFSNTTILTGQRYRFAVKARDSAGFESELVFSPPALFDSTPPVHINITTVSVTENVVSYNGTLYWVKELDDVKGATVYRLQISSVNITSSTLFEISFENQKQLHPVVIESGGTYTVAVSFISSPFYEGNRSIIVLAHGIPIYAVLNFTLLTSADVTVTGQTDHVIDVQQVSPTELQININVMDAESGIKDIYVGLGSTRGGFQFHPLTLVSSSYNILLPVEAPHGQTVHVTITAVNHAGCWSQFHSRPVIMDHTPPIISEAVMTTTYSTVGGQTLTSVRVTWTVMDEESLYIDCSCEIGENRMTRILYSDEGKSECETPYIYTEHGANLFTLIRCLNSANLQQITSVGPKTVALRAPEVRNVIIAFDTASETASGLPVVLSSWRLTFSWEIFDDSTEINGYSYRICQGTQRITEWENTDLRNYASLDHVTLKDDNVYTVEVKACDHDGLFCQVVNGSFLISGQSPTLTGVLPTATRQDGGLMLIWDNVFKIQSELLPRYTVTVGTDSGLDDLLRLVKTTQRHVTFGDYSGSDVYVVIKCSYVTGLFTTFRGKVIAF